MRLTPDGYLSKFMAYPKSFGQLRDELFGSRSTILSRSQVQTLLPAMAEVLGTIASVVGIASAGVALATRLHELVDRFGSTFDDIEVIAIDLNGFSIVLDELSKKLNAPDAGRTASNQLIGGIEDTMQTCQVLFKDIDDMIATTEDANTKMARFTTRVKWVFRKNKVKGMTATLECQKATLSLMLQILRNDDKYDR